jgi:hypothetical protein
MPRLSAAELERLKAEVSLEGVYLELAKNPTIRHLLFYHQRLEAGIQRYSVGIDTPRFRATSRGGTPLRSSCRAACTLLGVMRRFRPTGRPRWRAAAKPAWVRSTINSRSMWAKDAMM